MSQLWQIFFLPEENTWNLWNLQILKVEKKTKRNSHNFSSTRNVFELWKILFNFREVRRLYSFPFSSLPQSRLGNVHSSKKKKTARTFKYVSTAWKYFIFPFYRYKFISRDFFPFFQVFASTFFPNIYKFKKLTQN